jgi:hypothetical protein
LKRYTGITTAAFGHIAFLKDFKIKCEQQMRRSLLLCGLELKTATQASIEKQKFKKLPKPERRLRSQNADFEFVHSYYFEPPSVGMPKKRKKYLTRTFKMKVCCYKCFSFFIISPLKHINIVGHNIKTQSQSDHHYAHDNFMHQNINNNNNNNNLAHNNSSSSNNIK